VLLVLDGSTGQNAIAQAREFHSAVDLTGLAITKLDGSARGGVLLAVARELGVPVRFIGIGESAEDLDVFRAEDFARALVRAE
jgi:fused signal recognition particle receptor